MSIAIGHNLSTSLELSIASERMMGGTNLSAKFFTWKKAETKVVQSLSMSPEGEKLSESNFDQRRDSDSTRFAEAKCLIISL